MNIQRQGKNMKANPWYISNTDLNMIQLWDVNFINFHIL